MVRNIGLEIRRVKKSTVYSLIKSLRAVGILGNKSFKELQQQDTN